MQSAILDLYSNVKPQYDVWRSSISDSPHSDPLGWLYLGITELVIKEKMEQAGIEPDLFDDLYFAICWEVRERNMVLD